VRTPGVAGDQDRQFQGMTGDGASLLLAGALTPTDTSMT
jgi:hypothetical protein